MLDGFWPSTSLGIARGVVFNHAVARVGLIACGLLAILWSVHTFPTFVHTASLDQVSGRILQTEPFRLPLLQSLARETADGRELDRVRPETLREIAILNERLAEQDLVEARRTSVDTQFALAERDVARALHAAPSDSFLWLSLYWLRTATGGFTPDNLTLLRMSYETGPNEGWIATRRNRLAFIVFRFLPADLVEHAYAEFIAMLGSDFIDDAADIFTGPAWDERATLLARMENLPLPIRQRFARRVYDLGYDVTVPGIGRFGDRPWR